MYNHDDFNRIANPYYKGYYNGLYAGYIHGKLNTNPPRVCIIDLIYSQYNQGFHDGLHFGIYLIRRKEHKKETKNS